MTTKVESRARLVIIGSGPAGLTAAVYAGRAQLEPVVLEGIQPGGQLTITTEVENYPGFPDGIGGQELMTAMRKQAERFQARILATNVERLELRERPFVVETSEGVLHCEALILAMGASARFLGLPSEQKFLGRGVSACATCDGFFYRDQEVFIVGGGDTAMEEALFLTRFASKVTVVHRRAELRASRLMQERARANKKIAWALNTRIKEIHGDASQDGVVAVTLEDTGSGELRRLPCQGVFVAIGHHPNTAILKGQIDLDENGYIKLSGRSTATNVPGVFAAGDIADHSYRQAITAAGAGCMAAIDAERFLATDHVAR
ncbi:MAG: thioredoxin-disulfide reductase [Pseudomonadota bacterium]